ncbi:MAG: ATP phosphoribosyltransferase regulatory subunit [Eubacteriales bacterium]|nr:ATP phosphoribosyltransferase regulatory subunit [Eubacteriales bacterium]
MDERLLKREERAVFALRALYRRYGYLPFKMSKFETYELYARNLDFLPSDRVITFTDVDGRLMALKPDVTLSIIRRGEDLPGVRQRLCYDESVYRPSASSGPFREITQTGLECIGDLDAYDIGEVVSLARQSLALVGEDYVLALNHLGLLTALLDATGAEGEIRQALTACIAGKNGHDLRRLAAEQDLDPAAVEVLCEAAAVYAPLGEAVERLRPLCGGAAACALEELSGLYAMLSQEGDAEKLVFDFSLVSSTRYYNGVVFRGYLPDAAESVLAGGQYDELMRRMGRRCRGIGFALYLDRLGELDTGERSFDVDVLVLCGPATTAAAAQAAARRCIESGRSVSVQRAIPPRLRYRELLDLRGEEGAGC